ncbi:MAG TPA: hypothetical protein VF160_03520 [Candidatus Dormibacteraeota bacterium]
MLANQRLTATAGALLFVLSAAIAVTILYLPALLAAHYVVGLLLVPPLVLKLGTTGYRFARYYLRDPSYRLAGPPPPMLRLLVAPLLVASTVVVSATGIELWLFGLRFGQGWMTAHTLSAVAFILALGGHLFGHLRRSTGAVLTEFTAPTTSGAITRRSALLASLLLGVVLAAVSILYPTPFPPGAAGP